MAQQQNPYYGTGFYQPSGGYMQQPQQQQIIPQQQQALRQQAHKHNMQYLKECFH